MLGRVDLWLLIQECDVHRTPSKFLSAELRNASSPDPLAHECEGCCLETRFDCISRREVEKNHFSSVGLVNTPKAQG